MTIFSVQCSCTNSFPFHRMEVQNTNLHNFYFHFCSKIQRFNSILLYSEWELLLPFIIISISLRPETIHSMNSRKPNKQHATHFSLLFDSTLYALRNYTNMSNNLMNAMHSKRRIFIYYCQQKNERLLNCCMHIHCFCFVFGFFFRHVLYCLPEQWLLWRWILFCF